MDGKRGGKGEGIKRGKGEEGGTVGLAPWAQRGIDAPVHAALRSSLGQTKEGATLRA